MAHEKILIVEDDPAIADLIGRYLRLAGYQVSATLRSGEQALAQVAQLQPDLALMDIALSGELDGVQAAEQLHARFNVPVVFLTGCENAAQDGAGPPRHRSHQTHVGTAKR